MRAPHFPVLPLVLSLALASPVLAQDSSGNAAAPPAISPGFEQVVYKGLLGNVLDGVPMDPSDRLSLQRTNAVVSNTFLGRSLAVLAGLSNPVLLLGGFAWGVWAASNIKAAEAELRLAVDAARSADGIATAERMASLPRFSPNAEVATARVSPKPVLANANSTASSGPARHAPPHVFKIWLPQRSPASLR
jgi:hypothetical protein